MSFRRSDRRDSRKRALQKISDTLGDILNLGKDLSSVGLYHSRFVERAELFRNTIQRLANRAPQVQVVITYATKGDTSEVAKNVTRRLVRLQTQVEAALPNTVCRIQLLGPRELYDLSQKAPTEESELPFIGSPLSDGKNGYVVLARLGDYYSFIDDEGTLKRYIFEGNVRDFVGRGEVNRGIEASLSDPESPQFWWLNNGVTIVCTQARSMNNRFYLRDPLVVNGLQTSMVLHSHFRVNEVAEDDSRLLLIRVIQTSEPPVLDEIIRSTNSQTPVSAASLHATEQIQRDIEKFFLANGLFYDRRKNFYRNAGKASDSIISIPYLAQSVMAIGLSRPDDARARPSSLIKNPLNYKEVFSRDLDLGVFLWVARLQRRTDEFLRDQCLPASDRTNFRFHVAMLVAARALGFAPRRARQLTPLLTWEPTERDLKRALTRVKSAAARFATDHSQKPDQVAKNRDFVARLLKLAGYKAPPR